MALTRPAVEYDNVCTQVAPAAPRTLSVWPFGHERCAARLEELARWRDEHPVHAALALIHADGFVAVEAEREAPVALVVGRHSECDLELGRDGAAALRHAAVILWPDKLRIDAIDLRSEAGMYARDGRRAARITRGGSMLLGLGTRDVVALAAAAGEPFPRHADEVDARITHALYDDVDAAPPAPAAGHASFASSLERSRVFVSRVAGRLLRNADRAPIGDAMVLPATREQVGRGLVLGRYPRCDRTTTLEEDTGVSRVHALVLHERERLWAIDLASTNGTSIVARDGSEQDLGPLRRMGCLDDCTALRLARHEVVIEIRG